MSTKINRTRSNADTHERCWKIQQKGGKKIGEGAFGIVFSHPTNKSRVIKVGDADDNYLKYVKAVINKNNPFFPKIFSVEIGKHSYQITMERLYPFSNAQLDHHMMMNQVGCFSVYDIEQLDFTPPSTQAQELKKLLRRLFKTYDRDLHSQNVMLRKRKQKGKIKLELVVTDPIV